MPDDPRLSAEIVKEQFEQRQKLYASHPCKYSLLVDDETWKCICGLKFRFNEKGQAEILD